MKTKHDYFLATVGAAGASCLVWPFAARGAGYGVVTVNGQVRYAHQLAWEFAHGPIPPRWRTTQTCGNHACYNPAHVECVEPPYDYLVRRLKEIGLKKGPCEEWPYARYGSSYGNVVVRGKNEQAARVAYKIVKGRLRHGMDVCHACDNPPCFRPAHLFQGTRADNMRDCAMKGRISRIGLKGEASHFAKITEKDVLRIRKLHAEGVATVKLLKLFPAFGPSGLSHVINGHTWKHLPFKPLGLPRLARSA